jgi:hypothetical protein
MLAGDLGDDGVAAAQGGERRPGDSDAGRRPVSS